MLTSNILFLTTGSANSTVCLSMLRALGWNLGPVDDFNELPKLRRLNEAAINGRGFNVDAAARILADLPQPWIVKDPRFCHTLKRWLPLLTPYCPALLWVTKDLEYVQHSMTRRFNARAGWALKRSKLCQAHYDAWPYAKLKFDVARITQAVECYNPARSSQYRNVLKSQPIPGNIPGSL